jgi:ribosomal protein S18 acetylase RimI-like enzyme
MLTIKHIGVVSMAKFLAVLYGGIGLLVGLLVTVVSLAGSVLEKLLATNPYSHALINNQQGSLFSVVFGVGAIIILPILYAIMGAIGGLIMGVIANIALKISGGIELKVKKESWISKMEKLIRSATRIDKAKIVSLMTIYAKELKLPIALTEEYVEKYLSSSNSAILLAVQDREVVGMLSYSFRPDLFHANTVCFVEELIVEPSRRRSGIGTDLLTEIMKRVKEIGWAEISITVTVENEEAKKLYEKVGMEGGVLCLEKHFP